MKDSTAGKSWFPIRCDMVQRGEFRLLSPCQTVVLLDVNFKLHEHGSLVAGGWRQGPFFEGDERWSKRLKMSPETFRQARYKLGKTVGGTRKKEGLGWFTYSPGFRCKDGCSRQTKYYSAEYAMARKGVQSGSIRRETWQSLIEFLQRGQIGHGALVACSLLSYFWRIQGGREMGGILTPKAKIKLLGMTAVSFRKAVAEIKKAIPELLNVKETHHAFEITNWTGGIA